MINFKKVILLFQFLVIIGFLTFSSCDFNGKIKVALSKGAGSQHYENYEKWLTKFNPDIEFIDLYHIDKDEAMEVLKECSGLVLTGGPDVEPGRYGKPADTSRCEIDLVRDHLEFDIIRSAMKMEIPVLAICRGEQILNVAYGGSLIVDIPQDYDTTVIHRSDDPENCFHEVMVLENTFLNKLSGITTQRVNSNHHQAVDKLADVFKPSAYSKDMLVEAYEWKETNNKPFLIAVQWHPERLSEDNKLSYPIGKAFIEATEKYYYSKK